MELLSLLVSSQSRSASTQVNSSSCVGGRLKKDGTPDMRYAINKQYTSTSPSSSYGGSSSQLSSHSSLSGPCKRDGTPDMRYAVNKAFSGSSPASSGYSSGGSIYSSRSSLSASGSGSSSRGPLKGDGTPDMRYAVNKLFYGSSQSVGSSFGGSSYSSRPYSSGGAHIPDPAPVVP